MTRWGRQHTMGALLCSQHRPTVQQMTENSKET